MSVITDLSYLMSSNHNPLSKNMDNDSSYNSCNNSLDTTNLVVKERRRSGFRHQGDTKAIKGPTDLASLTMVGAAESGPAAWGASSHDQGDDRKVRITLSKTKWYWFFKNSLSKINHN